MEVTEQRHFLRHKTPQPKKGISIPIDHRHIWDLEIGSGTGKFSLSRAWQYPERQIIAIEKTRNKIKKFSKIKKRPPNLWVLHTNAVWWTAHFVPENILDNVFILYPNIYPKNKQANMRWVNRPFMSYLLSRIKIKGHLEFRTNHPEYYQEIKQKLPVKFPFMKCVKDSFLLKENHRPETDFERKYICKMPCSLLKFQKCF